MCAAPCSWRVVIMRMRGSSPQRGDDPGQMYARDSEYDLDAFPRLVT